MAPDKWLGKRFFPENTRYPSVLQCSRYLCSKPRESNCTKKLRAAAKLLSKRHLLKHPFAQVGVRAFAGRKGHRLRLERMFSMSSASSTPTCTRDQCEITNSRDAVSCAMVPAETTQPRLQHQTSNRCHLAPGTHRAHCRQFLKGSRHVSLCI